MSEDKRGKGRPRKVDTAKNIQVVNDQKELDDNLKNHDLNTDIPDNDNLSSSSINENDDDLKSFIKNDDKIKKPLSNGITTDNDIDDELDQEIQDFENQEGLNDIPEETYNPLKDPVKQRGYTDGSMGLGNDNNANPNGENVVYSQGEGEGKGHEKVISEPNYVGGGHAKKPDIDAALINPSNSGGEGVLDIPDDYNSNNNNQNQTNKSNNNNVSNSGSNTAKSEKKADSNLKELSPKEKRESVEQVVVVQVVVEQVVVEQVVVVQVVVGQVVVGQVAVFLLLLLLLLLPHLFLLHLQHFHLPTKLKYHQR